MKFIFQPGKMSKSGGGTDGFLKYNKSNPNYLFDCYPSIQIPSNSDNKDLVIRWVFDLMHNDYSAHNSTVNYYYEIVNEGTHYSTDDLYIVINESFEKFKSELEDFFKSKNVDIQIEPISEIERNVVLVRLTEALLPLIVPQDN